MRANFREEKRAFWANLVKTGYFRVETSFNKYIRLRKGEWCWKEGSVRKAVTAPAAPTTWLDPHRPGKGRRKPAPHKLSSDLVGTPWREHTRMNQSTHRHTHTTYVCTHL